MYSTKEYDNLRISLSAGFTDRRGRRKRQTEETRPLAFISFSESCISETEVFYEKEQEYEKNSRNRSSSCTHCKRIRIRCKSVL